jgi:hypothetical protein
MLGCVCGFFMGVTVASRRRPTCRELMRDPDRHPTFAELLMPPTRDRNPDWRRSFNHENTAPNSSEERPRRFRRSEPDELFIRVDEGPVQRGNSNGGPTTPKPGITPKPQPPGGRLIGPSGAPIGYRPNPSRPGANPPSYDMKPPSHETLELTIVLPASYVERLRPLLREDQGFTCLIKRLLHELAEVQA